MPIVRLLRRLRRRAPSGSVASDVAVMLAEAVAVEVEVPSVDAAGEGVLAGSVVVPAPADVPVAVTPPELVGVTSESLQAAAPTARSAVAIAIAARSATRRAEWGRIGVLMNFYGRARAAMRQRA